LTNFGAFEIHRRMAQSGKPGLGDVGFHRFHENALRCSSTAAINRLVHATDEKMREWFGQNASRVDSHLVDAQPMCASRVSSVGRDGYERDQETSAVDATTLSFGIVPISPCSRWLHRKAQRVAIAAGVIETHLAPSVETKSWDSVGF
jgi:hypothetical protein